MSRSCSKGGSAVALGDGDLLGRFLARRDEAAFEALIARLGPTVLGVCRRMLADPHDVDDAFQATLLVLVRRAGSIRDRDRVATWTYEVAVRVARRARLDAARRSAREHRAASPESGKADSPIDRSELKAQIDEEIARLPEHHRRAVLLCDVEGLSREEAADRLGWTPNMVRGRLDRARARLRDRLARRGLAPSGAWLALLAPAPIPKTALIQATARAALGRGSGTALALSKGVGMTMLLSEWKWIAGLLLAAGSAGLIAATAGPGRTDPPGVPAGPKPARRSIDVAESPAPGPPAVGQSFSDPNAPRPDMTAAPKSVPIRISGLVRDPAGRPVAGATVRVLGERFFDVPKRELHWLMGRATATTGADGRYRFAPVALPTQGLERVARGCTPYVECWVLAQVPGVGIGWHRGASMYAVPLPDPGDTQGRLPLDSPVEMDLSLRPEVELRWRVVDEAGRPVAGVKVEIRTMLLLDERRDWNPGSIEITPGLLPAGFGGVVTDGDGRFRMPGVPAESCCWLRFRRPDSSMEMVLIASTAAEAQPAPGEPPGPKQGVMPGHQVYPTEWTATMPNPRRVDVRVVAEDDGTPVPGIIVQTIDRTNLVGVMFGGAADAGGKLAIDLPPGDYYGLEATPASPDSRFVRTQLRPLVVTPEPAVQPLEFRVKTGAEVSIEAVDADTGRGIPDVRFDIKAERVGATWERLGENETIHPPDGEPTDAAGRLRAVLDPTRKEARRIRVAGVGRELPAEPPNVPILHPPLAPAPGAPPVLQPPVIPPRPLPYDISPEQSEPFEPTPGEPVRLRFVLRKK